MTCQDRHPLECQIPEHGALPISRRQQNCVQIGLLMRANLFAEFKSAALRHQAVRNCQPRPNFVVPRLSRTLRHALVEVRVIRDKEFHGNLLDTKVSRAGDSVNVRK